MTSASFPPPAAAFHTRPFRSKDMYSHTHVRESSRDTQRRTSPPSVLPKIATGRSSFSAKKLWKDHSDIDIYSAIQRDRISAPDESPIQASKNPKPLYRRAVPNPKPFRILHSESTYGSRDSLPGLYAEMTFLANAVRNNDGTTSYRGLCKKRRNQIRNQTVPTSAPGRLEASGSQDLHWASASNDKPVPRMLLPTSPGPNTNWYAWKMESPRETDSPRMEEKSKDVMHATRSDSGIGSRASFLHSVAQKRGQMVVSYQHNGRLHYSLVKPPEGTIQQHELANKRKGKPGEISSSYGTGSSLISSSYSSFTNSGGNSQGTLSVRGVGKGSKDGGNPYGQYAKVISEVDRAQDKTTQEETLDEGQECRQLPEQKEQHHLQSEVAKNRHGSDSKDTSDFKDTRDSKEDTGNSKDNSDFKDTSDSKEDTGDSKKDTGDFKDTTDSKDNGDSKGTSYSKEDMSEFKDDTGNSKNTTDSKDNGDSQGTSYSKEDTGDSRDTSDTKDNCDSKGTSDSKDIGDSNITGDSKDTGGSKEDTSDSKDIGDSNITGDSKDTGGSKEDTSDSNNIIDSKDTGDPKDSELQESSSEVKEVRSKAVHFADSIAANDDKSSSGVKETNSTSSASQNLNKTVDSQ